MGRHVTFESTIAGLISEKYMYILIAYFTSPLYCIYVRYQSIGYQEINMLKAFWSD